MVSKGRRPQDVTVVVLGAGITGAAIARECALSGVSLVVADTEDLASGATAWSTRLVHGGLRYLEYAELGLVRESVAERERLVRLAPHLVRPLEFLLPLERRSGGLLASAARLAGCEKLAARLMGARGRGAWAVRLGLSLYDLLSTDPLWPRHSVRGDGGGPQMDRTRFPLAMSYVDAQMLYPERFTVELLGDARAAAESSGARFEVFNHHAPRLEGRTVVLEPRSGAASPGRKQIRADAVVNATGAWVDITLASLPLESPRLIGGTKGSHLVLRSPELRDALRGCGVYAEAQDGRPVFVLPFIDGLVLVGTTEVPFSGDPAQALAADGEIDYLLCAVARLFPAIAPGRESLEQHYCGVRPLPSGRRTRRHMLLRHGRAPLPCWSAVGAKLTTCRSLAEQAASEILPAVGVAVTGSSRDRMLPGGRGLAGPEGIAREEHSLALRTGLSAAAAARMVKLYGSRAADVLGRCEGAPRMLEGCDLPASAVAFALREEWACTLEDVVERRLLLSFEPGLRRATLLSVAREMAWLGRLAKDAVVLSADALARRLWLRYAKKVEN